MERQGDRETGRETGRETDTDETRQMDGYIEMETDKWKQINGDREKETERDGKLLSFPRFTHLPQTMTVHS